MAEAGRAIRRLSRSEYITAKNASTFSNPDNFTLIRLEERGLRAVGEWPAANGYDALLQIIEQHIETASSAEERSRFEELRDGVIGVGRDVLTSVLSSLARQLGGLP